MNPKQKALDSNKPTLTLTKKSKPTLLLTPKQTEIRKIDLNTIANKSRNIT